MSGRIPDRASQPAHASGGHDEPAVDALLRGDEAAVRGFLDLLEREAFGIAIGRFRFERADAEDIFTAAFEVLWRDDRAALRRWRGRGPLVAYLRVVITSRCLMELRRRRRHPEAALEAALEPAAPAGAGRAANEDRALLRRALGELSDTDRELIELRYVKELGYPEIVEKTGRTYGAARKAVHVAVGRLRERMRALAPDAFGLPPALGGLDGGGGHGRGGKDEGGERGRGSGP